MRVAGGSTRSGARFKAQSLNPEQLMALIRADPSGPLDPKQPLLGPVGVAEIVLNLHVAAHKTGLAIGLLSIAESRKIISSSN